MLILVLASCGGRTSAVPVVGPDGKAAHQFKCIELVADCDDRGVCNPPADPDPFGGCKREAAKNCPAGFYFIGLSGPGSVYKRNTVFAVCNGYELSAGTRLTSPSDAGSVVTLGSSNSSASSTGCNNLVDDGPTVTATRVAAAPPVPAGGAILDGTYELTAFTAYTGVGGATGNLALTASEVQTISGTTVQEDGKINGRESRYTTTIRTSETTISTSDTCPSPRTATHGYTATAIELRIYDTKAGVTMEQVYKLR
jgi:hypothetical protein